MKHTPGPWEEWHERTGRTVVHRRGMQVCSINKNTPDHIANARLIAVAPEMLEALENLLEWAEWACGCSGNTGIVGDFNISELAGARTVITKAKGE